MKYLWLLLTLVFTGIIFYNSSLDMGASSFLSASAADFWQSVLTALHMNAPDNLEKILGKMAHFSSFAFLCWLWCRTFAAFHTSGRFACGYVMFFCLLTAVVDEYVQLFAAGRSGRLTDVLLDFSGALCMWLWLQMWSWKK